MTLLDADDNDDTSERARAVVGALLVIEAFEELKTIRKLLTPPES